MSHTGSLTPPVVSDPKERVQRPVLHELGDDPLWGAAGNHALQLQDVGVVKLPQNSRFTQKHPLLSVGSPPAQSLHSHQHFPATQRTIATSRDLPELGWSTERDNNLLDFDHGVHPW